MEYLVFLFRCLWNYAVGDSIQRVLHILVHILGNAGNMVQVIGSHYPNNQIQILQDGVQALACFSS